MKRVALEISQESAWQRKRRKAQGSSCACEKRKYNVLHVPFHQHTLVVRLPLRLFPSNHSSIEGGSGPFKTGSSSSVVFAFNPSQRRNARKRKTYAGYAARTASDKATQIENEQQSRGKWSALLMSIQNEENHSNCERVCSQLLQEKKLTESHEEVSSKTFRADLKLPLAIPPATCSSMNNSGTPQT
jgi:hypothetical protein